MAEHKASGSEDDLRDGRELGPRSTVRRDPRADPDDDEPSGRIDVVTMERGGGNNPGFESVQSAALSFRREIAKLHQQATAFERAVEDQRRERADALERIEHATTRANEAERKLEVASASVEKLRNERDDALATAARAETELKEIREREQSGAKKGVEELQSLREQLERANADLAQSRQETAAAKKEGEWLEKALADARTTEEKLSGATKELTETRAAVTEARSQCEKLERELEATRLARDVSIERAASAERATEEARSEARKDRVRIQRELEAANLRAEGAERAKAIVDESVKQLRDEVTSVFARWQPAIVAPAPTPAVLVDTSLARATFDDDDDDGAPEEETTPLIRRKPTSFPPPVAEARPFSMRPDSAPPLEDGDWTEESIPPSNVRKPPPPPPLPAETSASPSASTPPTASTPPATRSVPPPLPAAARGSQRPSGAMPAVSPSTPPKIPDAPVSTQALSEVSRKSRESLFEQLADPGQAREAAAELQSHPDWLRGRPPLELLIALSHLDYDTEAPLFDVARNWENEPLSRALVAGLRDEADPKLREHAAWLLKHFGSPGAWPALAELVTNDSESSAVRRWLLEAIGRLVGMQAIGWRDVGDLVQRIIHSADASLRDGVIAVVAALERSDDKRRLLLEVLRTDNDENVLSSAVQALPTALPIDLDPSVVERLLGHPSARVQQSVVEFVERTRRNAKN